VSKVEVSITIAATPAAIWAVVMDPDRLGDWVTIHRGLGKADPAPLKLGSKLEQTLEIRGAPFKVKWTVAEATKPSIAVWEGSGPARSRAHTAYKLTPEGKGKTRFDYENDFKTPLGPLGKIAGRLLVGGTSEREANASLAKLKALLEA